jgi:hypothetical protein
MQRPDGGASNAKSPGRFNRRKEHDALIQKILCALSIEGVLAWENKTGEGHFRGAWIRFGLEGSSDVIGCMANGKFMAIEVKTGTGRLEGQQDRFAEAVVKRGGHYGIARSVEDAVALVQHWQRS